LGESQESAATPEENDRRAQMKPITNIEAGLLENRDQFSDPFFSRFSLRPAAKPLQLNDEITKDYLFPTLYGNVTCAIGIFLCSYEKALQQMPDKDLRPVRMTKGRALVAFSCYVYRNVLGVAPYNEIAMTIPVQSGPGSDIPVLPMLLPKLFKRSGYFVFSMPVTSLENQIRGVRIWGLPKVVQQIDIDCENDECVTTAYEESGASYFRLRVPTRGKAQDFDVTSKLYTRLNGEKLNSTTCFQGSFNMNQYPGMLLGASPQPDREYLWCSETPSGRALQELELDPHPFQLRYAAHMSSCFDLPDGQ
jgi:hypothetical protein